MGKITPLTMRMLFKVNNFETKYDSFYKKEIKFNKPIFIELSNWNELKHKFLKERIALRSGIPIEMAIDIEKTHINETKAAVSNWNSPGWEKDRNNYQFLLKYYLKLLEETDPEKLQMPNDEENRTDDKKNPLIFDNNTLKDLYDKCNTECFEDVKYPEFENWFRKKPVGKPTYKKGKKTEFCRQLGEIQGKINKEHVGKIGEWMEQIDLKSYYILKGRPRKK